jgi:membrane protein YdbS with pleckstrin-like domain
VAYPDELLDEGERVLLHRRPHWRLLVGPVLAFLITLGVAGYLAALIYGQGSQQWGWPVIAAGVVVLVAWLTVLPVTRWRTTHLVVTTRRVLVREGVRRAQSLEIPLDRVTEVRTHRTRSGRLLGYGSLVLRAGPDGEVEFADVPGAERVRSVLTAPR